MRRKRWMARLLALTLLFAVTAPALAVETEKDTAKAKVVFQAGEPDTNGCFMVTLTISDAKFQAFQFVLRYDKTTVVPVSQKNGEETNRFFDFAQQGEGTDWMATVGTGIDAERQLIDFTGYVTPGQAAAIDREEIVGAANIGEAGVTVFQFQFKKVGIEPVKLEIASSENGEIYQEFLPDGGGLSFSGERQPATITFSLPAMLGTSTTVDAAQPEAAKSDMTVAQRLKGTVILQIGNYAAAVDGMLVHIDADNKAVVPFAEHDRTYVPVRFIAEKMGAKVDWEQDNTTVVIVKDGKTIRMPIGSAAYTVNGVPREMDAIPVASGERVLVPIRFVAEALGKSVEWDSINQFVIVAPEDMPWVLDRQTEKAATNDISLLLSPLMRDLFGQKKED